MLVTLNEFDAATIETITTALQDFKEQFNILEKNLMNLKKLAKLIGVPEVVLEALSPGMIKRLQTKPEVLVEFIIKFAR
jgi:Tfp pilus assembly protein PilO